MTKLCVECKWAHCIDPALAPEHQYWQCGHPTATIPAQVHLVTGAVKPSVQASCDMVRNLDRNLRGEVWCGPGGVFWEPIPIGKISGLGFGEREN